MQTLEDGGVITWDQLPAGALCSAEETDAADADEVWYEQAAADPNASPVRIEGQVLDLAPLVPVGGATANEAGLFNAFESTALTIVKTLSGDGAQQEVDKTFEVELVCTLTDATRPEGIEVWNDVITLSAANNWREVIPALASGAECRATETDTGGAARTLLRIDDNVIGAKSGQFTAEGTVIALSVENMFILPLAITGGDLWAAALVALLLVLLGGAAILLRRRREHRGEVSGELG